MAKGRNIPNISDVVTQRRAVLAQWLEDIQSNPEAAPPADLDYSFKNKTSPQEIPLAAENFSALPQDGTPYCISELHSGYAANPEEQAAFLEQQRMKIQKHYPPHVTLVPVTTAEGFASFAIVGVTADQANAIDAAVKEAAWLKNWQEKLESPDKSTVSVAQAMLQQEMKRQGIKNTTPVVEDTSPQPSLLQKTWGVVTAISSLSVGLCKLGAMKLHMMVFPSAWSDLNDKVSEAFDRAEAAQAAREPTPPAPQTVENIIVDPKDLQARAEAIVAQMTIVPPETNIPAVEAEAEVISSTPHSPAMQEALRQAMNPDAGKSTGDAPPPPVMRVIKAPGKTSYGMTA